MRSRLLCGFWITRVSRSACRWLLIRALRSLGNHDAWYLIQCNEVLHLFRPGIPGINYHEFRWYKHTKVPYLCRGLHRKDSAVCLAAYPLYYTVVASVRDTEREWEGEWESEERGRPLYAGMMPLLRDLYRNMQPPVMLEEDAIFFLGFSGISVFFYKGPKTANYPPTHLLCFVLEKLLYMMFSVFKSRLFIGMYYL